MVGRIGLANVSPVVSSTATAEFPAHAHDVLLTVAAEIGLPAAAVLIVLTLLWTRTFLRTAKALPDARDRGLMAGLAGAAATFVGEGVFDATLRASVVLVLLALCVGLALAVAEIARGNATDLPSPPGGMSGRRLAHDQG